MDASHDEETAKRSRRRALKDLNLSPQESTYTCFVLLGETIT
jgi:hypothetical protein